MQKNKTVLITGASNGIGLALARVFARNGYNLVLVARNLEKLKQVKTDLEKEFKVEIRILSKDLAAPNSAQEVFTALQAGQIEIEILVNNAGFAEYGLFSAVPLERHLSEINLNVYTLTALTGLFLPKMIERRSGKILNVASTAAFQPGPLMAVYYATKAFVLSFSESLRNENKNFGIAVTALCPGPTKTGFGDKSDLNKSRLLAYAAPMTAVEVAEAGYAGLLNNKAVVIPGFMNKFLAFGTKVLPRSLVVAISRWTLELKK